MKKTIQLYLSVIIILTFFNVLLVNNYPTVAIIFDILTMAIAFLGLADQSNEGRWKHESS